MRLFSNIRSIVLDAIAFARNLCRSRSASPQRTFSVLALFAIGDVYVSLCKKALTLHLARGEGRERYFGCNLMQRKVLASSHQHLTLIANKRHRV